jgi:hypothetical protein
MEHPSAANRLLESGALVGFRVLETSVQSSPDKETFSVRAELALGDDEEEDPSDLVEWRAFGFIFVLAVLSFADARPRGVSELDYVEGDQFSLSDLMDSLSFAQGELHFSADYIRGRCMKTDIRLASNRRVTLSTWGRGKQALFWLDRLKGKVPLRVVTGGAI